MMENTEMLLKEFKDAVLKRTAADKEGKYKIVNRNHDKILHIVRLLGANNQMDALKRLLDHPTIEVRSVAATYLLPIDEKSAMKVLKAVVKAEDFISFDTQMVIQEWKNGNIKSFLTNLANGIEV